MNKIPYDELEQMYLQEHDLVDKLQAELKHVYSSVPCPKCGYGITSGCYGCEIKRLQAELEAHQYECGKLLRENRKQAEEIQRLKGLLLWWETYIDTDETIRPPIKETRKALRNLKGETE